MGRPIDADALETYWECFDDPDLDYQYVLKADIDAAPTIDPVRHGRWRYFHKFRRVEAKGIVKCTLCNAAFVRVIGTDFSYCPSCGAKMIGEEG